MKVSAIIREDRVDRFGLAPVIIRINAGHKRYFKPTGIKVKPSDFKKGVIINRPDAKALTQKLQTLIIQYDGEKEYAAVKFSDLTKEHIALNKSKQTRSHSTLAYYQTELDKFISFAGNINVTDVTASLLERYHAHMIGIPNSNNTIWKAFKFIKTIINKAIQKGLIYESPFTKLPDRVKYKQSERSFLTSEEVKKIAAAKFSDFDSNIANWFLFQCNTGLAISDLRKVDLSILKREKKITLARTKTEVPVFIPLSKEAVSLLPKLKPLPTSDQQYNRSLKTIAATAGIDKPLTSHMARHTFAIRLAELKVSKEVAGKLLGHTKTSTTDIYYKIQDKRVEEEFKGFKY